MKRPGNTALSRLNMTVAGVGGVTYFARALQDSRGYIEALSKARDHLCDTAENVQRLQNTRAGTLKLFASMTKFNNASKYPRVH